MKTLIGIRREDKNPWEKRVPLIPSHVQEIVSNHPVEIWLQLSPTRIFPDEDYLQVGARIEEDLSPCSIVLAIKEIPLHFFREDKIYVFFSHTVKGQPHNMPMLKKMIDLRCTLIDYEKIQSEKGQRLLFFGRQAGEAGMIDTLWALGQRLNHEKVENPFSSLQQAFKYQSLVEAREEVEKVGWKVHEQGIPPSLVPLVCGFLGYGHVSQGAQEIFDLLPHQVLEPDRLPSFVEEGNYSSSRLYKVVFREEDLVKPVAPGMEFNLQDYYQNPHRYVPVFESYLPHLTILVNCVYWTSRYPRFVTKKGLKQLYRMTSQPRLRVIGDISCDIEGSMECTIHATSPASPVYVYDPIKENTSYGVAGRGPVIMAIDNLPAEIPLESSIYFSGALKPFVPLLARADFSRNFAECNLSEPLKKAVILYKGLFTPEFQYMKEFIKNHQGVTS